MGLVQFEDGKVLYYPYVPSKSAGVAYMVLFILVTVAHILSMGHYKTWYFTPLILGGICEIFGYYGRLWAHDRPDSPGPFMLQLMLILVSPVFVSATVYVTLGKLRQVVLGEPKRRCSPTSFFVITDIIAFCTQIGGSLVQVTGNLKIMDIGDHVVLGGLVFQLVVMIVFMTLVWRYYRKTLEETPVPWRRYTAVLAVSVTMIWIRNLVRAIEFVQGFHGFISENEAMMYVFDATLMLLVLVLFVVLHPGRLIRRTQMGFIQKITGTNAVHRDHFELS
ncbi:RTA1-domain-containing protein [Thozetella sp. PMI_491]|nr:RTA1-domain-containing protein [Thozetella sp. PMI_491]